MLKVEKIKKTYRQAGKDISLLNHLSFELKQGESLSIVGPSGCGKSTLITLVAGLDQPDQGKIFINNTDITSLTESQKTNIRASSIGIVFQQFHLIPHLNALENVRLPLEIKGDHNVKEKALKELKKVGLSHRVHHMPKQLSGGEKQRVGIARATVNRPALILADEPTGSLDKDHGQVIIDLLFSLVKEYKSMLVLVTHNEKLAKKTDHIICL